MTTKTTLPKDLDLLASLGADIPQPPVSSDNIRESNLGGTGKTGVTSSTEDKALTLLGAGIQSEAVAAALGVTPARISQLLADEVFSKKVAALKYESLQKHNKRDSAYDSLEDRLIEKLDKALPLMVKPESILKAITVVNGAKRRGSSKPTEVVNQQNIVNLIVPSVITNKFTTNLDNQVIKAGEQELLTMPSGNLLKRVEEAEAEREEETKRLGGHDL